MNAATTHFNRWIRFNLVGALGMAVQLGSLALLNRIVHGHYLLATAAAIELTLLHNFAWHVRFTWPGTRSRGALARALLRFHLANGAVSMGGNLLLMRLFVGLLHFPVLAGNVLAIVCCSLANFALSDRWSFAPGRAAEVTASVQPLRSSCALAMLSMLAGALHGQSLPTGPAPTAKAHYEYLESVGVFCGAGASTSAVASKPTTGCGAGSVLPPLPVFVELGIMGPQANRSYLSGYVSVDSFLPLAPLSKRYVPLVLFGYSRLFETGHSLDYGLALATPRFGRRAAPGSSFRFELRDYWTFANPSQHNIMLRIGWMTEVAD